MDSKTIEVLLAAARAGAAPQKLDKTDTLQHYAVPAGVDIRTVNLEQGEMSPARKRGHVKVFDAASFSDLIAKNVGAGQIVVYIDRDASNPRIIAVLNDHGGSEDGPGWGDYRIEIVFRPTAQWQKWRAIDGKLLPQLQFAEFIEDNLADIMQPTGADMLEIAQELSARRSVDFKSNVRLADGRLQFQNIENIEAQVGAGQVAVPPTIVLGLAPVIGVSPFRVDARFRYRIENGKLTLGIKMQRVEDVMAAVVNDMVEGSVATEGRAAVKGIQLPDDALRVEGIAPPPLAA